MYISGSENKKTWNCRETATEDAITKAFLLFPGDAQSFPPTSQSSLFKLFLPTDVSLYSFGVRLLASLITVRVARWLKVIPFLGAERAQIYILKNKHAIFRWPQNPQLFTHKYLTESSETH